MCQYNLNDFQDTMLSFSSLYWLSGTGTLLRGTLSGATRIITTKLFSPELQLHFIEKYRVTFTMNATHQIVLISKNDRFKKTDLSSWKTLTVGGSKVPFHIQSEFKDCLPNGNIIIGYGELKRNFPILCST